MGTRFQFLADAQGLIVGMPDPKHPLVAAHRPDAASHLIRQRLKAAPMIGSRQRARQRVAWPLLRLSAQKIRDGFLKAALQEMLIARKWNPALLRKAGLCRQMKAVNGIEKEAGANALIQVRACGPKPLQRVTFPQEFRSRSGRAKHVERTIPCFRIGGSDHFYKVGKSHDDYVPELVAGF